MAFNLENHLKKMTRRVSTGEREGQTTVIVHAARTYPTTALDLWDALTSPERLSRWFLPVSGELRPGGRYQFVGNAGGTINECEPPEKIGATWEYGGGVSWLSLRLLPESDGTRLELEHEAHIIPEFTDRFGPGAVGVGWDMGFMGLARHLEDPAAFPTTPEVDGWSSSPEAMDFYRVTSDAWGKADLGVGTAPEAANAAAEATRAFYSGELGPMDAGSGGEAVEPGA